MSELLPVRAHPNFNQGLRHYKLYDTGKQTNTFKFDCNIIEEHYDNVFTPCHDGNYEGLLFNMRLTTTLIVYGIKII